MTLLKDVVVIILPLASRTQRTPLNLMGRIYVKYSRLFGRPVSIRRRWR